MPSRTRSVAPAATASVGQRLEPVDRVEPLADEQVVGDEQGVEAELLDPPRERLDATRPLGAVALPDVRGQEHPESTDVGHDGPPPNAGRRPHRPWYSGSRLAKKRGAPSSRSSVAKTRSDAVQLGREAGLDVGLDREVDQALRLADRERSALGDLLADARAPRRPPGRGHDLVHEPDPLGLGRGQDAPGQDQLLGPRGPDDPRQPLRPAGARRDGQAHLGQAELRALRGDPDVAAQRQLEPAAERVALDRGDRRHRQRRQPGRDAGLQLVPRASAGAALGLELAHVRAGREGPLASPAHDDRADVAGIGGGERRPARHRAPRAAPASRGSAAG